MVITAQGVVRRRAGVAGVYAILIVGSLVMAYPLVYGLMAGLSTLPEYELNAFLPIPHHPSLDNLQTVLAGANLWLMFRNTAIRALWYGFWPSLLALIAGYAFARLRFPGRNILFMVLLSGLMFPPQVSIVPLYIMVAHWPLIGGNNILGQGGTGMINTWWALLTIGLINGFELFLMRQAISAVPYEYEEAARVDGAGVLRIIFTIYAPMVKPVIATLTLINMINVWNDYFGPLIFASDNPAIATVSLGVTNFAGAVLANGQTNYPAIFMGTTIAMLPTIVIFLFFQRYIVQGFANAGLKG